MRKTRIDEIGWSSNAIVGLCSSETEFPKINRRKNPKEQSFLLRVHIGTANIKLQLEQAEAW
jgi:hypothetical protein